MVNYYQFLLLLKQVGGEYDVYIPWRDLRNDQ